MESSVSDRLWRSLESKHILLLMYAWDILLWIDLVVQEKTLLIGCEMYLHNNYKKKGHEYSILSI